MRRPSATRTALVYPRPVVDLQDSAGTRRRDSGLSRRPALPATAASDSRQAELAYARTVRDWRSGGTDKGGRDREIAAPISYSV